MSTYYCTQLLHWHCMYARHYYWRSGTLSHPLSNDAERLLLNGWSDNLQQVSLGCTSHLKWCHSSVSPPAETAFSTWPGGFGEFLNGCYINSDSLNAYKCMHK